MHLSLILLLLPLLESLAVPLSQNEIICNRLNIDNAVIRGPYREIYKYNNRADYECNRGYTGDFSLTCTEHGWTGQRRECTKITCNIIHDDDNADIAGEIKPIYQYDDQVQFVCKNGYEGRYTLTCTEHGWTKTSQCTEVLCQRPDIKNAKLTSYRRQSYRHNERFHYTCADNDSIFTATCQQGNWIGTQNCPEVLCQRPDIKNAKHTTQLRQSYRHNEYVQYTCPDNDRIFTATCQQGNWIGTQNCSEIICNRLNIDNAVIRGPYREIYKYNNRADYECNRGYTGDFSLTCTEHGWTGQRRECTKITCNIIHDDDNADIAGEIKPIYQYDDQVQFVCKNGYEGRYTLTCTEHGWTKTSQCTEVLCQRPDIKNAKLTSYRRQSYRHNERVHYTCADNDSIFTATCQQGNWIGTQNCPEVLCQRPDIKNAKHTTQLRQSYRHNEYVQYTCPDNDRIFTATCQQGNWIGTQNCSEIICNRLNIDNAVIRGPYREIYKYNHRADYECNRGYTGDFSLTCTEHGWTGQRRECTKITCNIIHDDDNADIAGEIKPIYQYDDQVQFVCKNGYEGRYTLTCTEHGWTKTSQCTEVLCQRPDIKNAKLTSYRRQSYRHNERVHYTCADNDSIFTATCQQGNWIGTQNCPEVLCQRPDIKNAKHTTQLRQSYRHNEYVQYTCADNDRIFTATCQQGNWIGTQNCSEVLCQRPDIKNAKHTTQLRQSYRNNEYVQYTCLDNETTSFTATCQQGNWIGTQNCSENCPKATIPNGFVVVSENKLYYTCDKGFKLVTKGWWGVAKCNGRLWSGFERCIEKKQCKEIPVIPNGKGTLQSTNRGRDELQIDCNKGYEATVKSLTCLGGQWGSAGKSVSICTIIPTNCNQPPRVENTFITTPPEKIYLSGSEVSYQCRDKYTLEGKHTLKCENGTWQESNFTCTPPVGCGKAPPLADGDTKYGIKFQHRHNEQVEYVCQNYYVMEGEPFKTCKNGEWIGEMRCLKPCTVNREIMGAHNIDFKFRADDKLYSHHNQEMEFRCVGRTRHDGIVAMRQACVDGVMHLPTCH